MQPSGIDFPQKLSTTVIWQILRSMETILKICWSMETILKILRSMETILKRQKDRSYVLRQILEICLNFSSLTDLWWKFVCE